MTISRRLTTVLAFGVFAVMTGCMAKLTVDHLRGMKPQRPDELNRLEPFVGRWTWKGEATVAGVEEVLRFTGTRDTRWEGDRRYLVSRESGTMEGLGESEGLSTWAYDTRRRTFRTQWIDSAGTITTGTADYDEQTDTWHLRGISRSPSGKTSVTGHVRFPDAETMEWDWAEYSHFGLKETLHLTGTCKRQR